MTCSSSFQASAGIQLGAIASLTASADTTSQQPHALSFGRSITSPRSFVGSNAWLGAAGRPPAPLNNSSSNGNGTSDSQLRAKSLLVVPSCISPVAAISLPWHPSTNHTNPQEPPTQPDQENLTPSSVPRFPPAQRRHQQQQKQAARTIVSDSKPSTDKASDHNQFRTASAAIAADEQDHLCVEIASGRKRVYRGIAGTEQGVNWEGFDMVEAHHTAKEGMRALVHSYLLPQGFPHSVAPEYATYM